MLVLVGNPGVGKTTICYGLIDFISPTIRHIRRYHERDLLSKIRESIGKSADYHRQCLHMIDDDLVMLDDMGSTKYSEWAEEVLTAVIDVMYERETPFVITSNHTRQEIESTYHPRIASRIFAAENTIIEFWDTPDYRQHD